MAEGQLDGESAIVGNRNFDGSLLPGEQVGQYNLSGGQIQPPVVPDEATLQPGGVGFEGDDRQWWVGACGRLRRQGDGRLLPIE